MPDTGRDYQRVCRAQDETVALVPESVSVITESAYRDSSASISGVRDLTIPNTLPPSPVPDIEVSQTSKGRGLGVVIAHQRETEPLPLTLYKVCPDPYHTSADGDARVHAAVGGGGTGHRQETRRQGRV